MNEFKIQQKLKAHTISLEKIILNPYNPTQLITIGLDSFLTIWKLPSFQQQQKVNLKSPYLTSIIEFSNSLERGFLVGSGHGYLFKLDENFQLINSQKIHSESITSIISTVEYIITISHDGRVCLLNKETLSLTKILQLHSPLLSCIQYQDNLYIASYKSFIINLTTFQIKQTQRFNNFCITHNKIFGCSDDKGLTCLNTGSNTYVPTEFILPYKRKIILFSEKSICIVNHLDRMAWKSVNYPIISCGEEIKSGIVYGGSIIIGGNEGNLYWIKVEDCNQITEN